MARASSKLAQIGCQVGPKLPAGGVSARAEIKECAETLVVGPKWGQVASKLAKVGSKLARATSKLAQVGRQVGPKLLPGAVSARAEIQECAEALVVAPKWLQLASKLAKVGSKLGQLGCQVDPPLAQAGVSARPENQECAETLVVAPNWLQVMVDVVFVVIVVFSEFGERASLVALPKGKTLKSSQTTSGQICFHKFGPKVCRTRSAQMGQPVLLAAVAAVIAAAKPARV